MRARPLIIIFLSVFLLSGCVTETTGGRKKDVDPEVVVEKLVNLGIGYLRQRELTRAKANLRKALDIEPRSPLAHTTLGVIFELEGEDRLAEEHFKKAIRSDRDFSQARNNYGAFLFAQGRFEEAVAQLLLATEDRFYPKRPHAFENLGVSYLRLGETVKAENAFTRAVELNFSQSRALLELGGIRFDQKDFVESRRLYRKHASVSQQSARSLWLCIRLARVFDDTDEEASCALVLKNIFPASDEYNQYKKTV